MGEQMNSRGAGSQETCVIDSAGTLDKPLHYVWAPVFPSEKEGREIQATLRSPTGKGHPGHRFTSVPTDQLRKKGLGGERTRGRENKGWIGNETVASLCAHNPTHTCAHTSLSHTHKYTQRFQEIHWQQDPGLGARRPEFWS